SHLDLEAGVDGHVNIARTVEGFADFRIVRLVAMGQQGDELAVVIADDSRYLSLRPFYFDERGTIVVATKAARLVAFYEGSVAGAPTHAGTQIAQQIERQTAERIVPAVSAHAGAIDVDSQRFVLGAMLFQFIPITGGEGQAVPVV